MAQVVEAYTASAWPSKSHRSVSAFSLLGVVMEQFSRRCKTPSDLPDPVNQRLNMYTLAASAAGVGMLAMVQPAEGKIIYTPAHKTIRLHQHFNLDLNHDGITDFTLQVKSTQTRGTSRFSTLEVLPQKNNAVEGAKTNTSFGGMYAFALQRGAVIGAKQPFSGTLMARVGTIDGISFDVGKWLNVKNRYLGLKLQIHGKTHYGWARLSVVNTQFLITSATLTGYAYETVPNKSTVAGKTTGQGEASSDSIEASPRIFGVPTRGPASLGTLAIGSRGLSAWRQESVGSLRTRGPRASPSSP